ncbi:MAG: 3-hydroxyacyl-ACP dehydratase FabZ [Armatimonadota bacterium]
MEMDIVEIERTLPHRYPFLMVDRIVELEPGERAVGIKNVTRNEEFFVGHFPGEPVMPGVLIMEAMAQVGGVLLLVTINQPGKLALFGGADAVRFKKRVVPGDQLVSEVRIQKIKGNMGRVAGEARVNGELVARGIYSFALVDAEGAQSAKETAVVEATE